MLTTNEQRARFAQSMHEFKKELVKAGFRESEAVQIIIAFVRGYASTGGS